MPRPTRRRRRLVTLTTDIGWAYAAQMKAVLASRIGADRIVDLAHDLPAHGIREGAFLLRAMAERFPAGTVHLCVVDPGVGGRRAPVAVRCRDGSFLVGPDNGVLAPLAERLGVERVVRIDPRTVALAARVGTTFDGRDLFVPAAARLADGEPVSRLGSPGTLTPLPLPSARAESTQVVGEVLHTDHFGNVITNIRPRTVRVYPPGVFELTIGRRRRTGVRMARSYEGLGRGQVGLLVSSFGFIEVARSEGSARDAFGARTGDTVRLRWSPRSSHRRRPPARRSQP